MSSFIKIPAKKKQNELKKSKVKIVKFLNMALKLVKLKFKIKKNYAGIEFFDILIKLYIL